MAETWEGIPRYPGYKASDQGRIGSCLRCPGGRQRGKWVIGSKVMRILKPAYDKGGYARVGLRRDNKRHMMGVATLVMLAFRGPRPDELEICHNNGIPDDNRLDNLRYDTHSANVLESYAVLRQKEERRR